MGELYYGSDPALIVGKMMADPPPPIPGIRRLRQKLRLAREAGMPTDEIWAEIQRVKKARNEMGVPRHERRKGVIVQVGPALRGDCQYCGIPIYHELAVRARNDNKVWHPQCFAPHLNPQRGWPQPRRVREANAQGSHTRSEWMRVKSDYRNRCAYCGISGVPMTKDHVVPLARGGSDYIENIVPACKTCNSRKHAKLLHDWAH